MKEKHIGLFWGVVLLLAVFMTNPDGKAAVRVLHISGNKGLLLLAIAAVVAILTVCLKRRISVDSVMILLILRIPVCLVSALYIDPALNSQGRILIQVLIVAAYFIGRQYSVDANKVGFMFLLASLVVTAQVFVTYKKNGLLMSDPWYSHFMEIPYGGSNVIASMLLPGIFVLLELKKPSIPRLVKCILFLCLMLGLYLTSSRGALLVFALLFPVYVIFRMRRFSMCTKRSVFALLLFLYFIAVVGYVVIDFSRISSDFNGRFVLWVNALRTFAQHPLFGGGMVYTGVNRVVGHDVFSGTHNVILETLRESGFVGCVLFLAVIVKVLGTVKNGIFGKEDGLLCWVLVCMFADMLFEGSYFNYTSDILFWILAGIHMRK